MGGAQDFPALWDPGHVTDSIRDYGFPEREEIPVCGKGGGVGRLGGGVEVFVNG